MSASLGGTTGRSMCWVGGSGSAGSGGSVIGFGGILLSRGRSYLDVTSIKISLCACCIESTFVPLGLKAQTSHFLLIF